MYFLLVVLHWDNGCKQQQDFTRLPTLPYRTVANSGTELLGRETEILICAAVLPIQRCTNHGGYSALRLMNSVNTAQVSSP